MYPGKWTELEKAIDSVIRRHCILEGGEGNLADAIADWRGENDLVSANRVLDNLVEKIASLVQQ